MRWVAFLVAAGCYSPTPLVGVPCAPEGSPSRCPEGQVCVVTGSGAYCQDMAQPNQIDAARPVDAEIDAPDDDDDNDGVLDVDDNCPLAANASQHDEDADALGDACDPCPPSATNTDTDADGVGDVCDPRPNTAGDVIALFEGFGAGVPAGWTQIGTAWTAGIDDVRVTCGANAKCILQTPQQTKNRMTVAAALVIESASSLSANTDAGVSLLYAAAPEAGVTCHLFEAMNAGAHALTLYNLTTSASVNSTGYGWAFNTTYVMSLNRNMSNFYCLATTTSGSATAQPGTPASLPNNGSVVIRVFSATARAAWVLVVEN